MAQENEPTGSLAAMLARIDERTKTTAEEVKVINGKLENHYVTQDEFKPVKALLFGLVGLILTSFVVAVIALVVKAGVK